MPNVIVSAIWVTLTEIAFYISGYIVNSAVGRILGPADYGRYALVATLTSSILVLIGTGIPTAMGKYISEYFETDPGMVRAIKKQSLKLQLVLIALLSIPFFLLSPQIAKTLGDPSLTRLFQISTLIIPTFSFASFYLSYYSGLHLFHYQSVLKVIRLSARLIFIISMTYFFGLYGSITSYLAAPIAVILVGYFMDRAVENRHLGKNTVDKRAFDGRKLLNYAWQVIVFLLSFELITGVTLYMVKGILKDDYLTGIYNASLMVGKIPYFVFYALSIVLLPVISKSTSEKNHSDTRNIIYQSIRIITILLVPTMILMSIYSPQIIRFLYSSAYLEASYPMSILVIGVGFLTLFYIMSFVMNGAGKTKIPMILSATAVFINIALNYFLLKKIGIIGSAVSTLITSIVSLIAMLYFLYAEFKVYLNLKSLTRIVFGGVIIYFVSSYFPSGNISFVISSLILFGIYIFLLFLTGEISKKDLVFLQGLPKKPKIEEKILEEEPMD